MRNVRAFLRADAASRIGSHEFPCSLSSAEKLSTLGTRGALRLRPRFRCCCRRGTYCRRNVRAQSANAAEDLWLCPTGNFKKIPVNTIYIFQPNFEIKLKLYAGNVFHPVASHKLTNSVKDMRVYKGNLKFPTCAPLSGDFSVKIPHSPKK